MYIPALWSQYHWNVAIKDSDQFWAVHVRILSWCITTTATMTLKSYMYIPVLPPQFPFYLSFPPLGSMLNIHFVYICTHPCMVHIHARYISMHGKIYARVQERYIYGYSYSISPHLPLLPYSLAYSIVPLCNHLWPVPDVNWFLCSPPSWCCPPPLATYPWKPDNCFHQPGFNTGFCQPDKWNCELLSLQLPPNPKL